MANEEDPPFEPYLLVTSRWLVRYLLPTLAVTYDKFHASLRITLPEPRSLLDMARSAEAATVVLDSIEVLVDLGAQMNVTDQEILAALEEVGVGGFSEDHAGYLATVGIVLRLMLRHCTHDPATLFESTRADLRTLGSDIDDQAFASIVRNLKGTL